MPRPPGVSGIAVISLAKEKTASTSAQPTSLLDTPTARSDISSTRYSERWLTIVASVSQYQRARRSRIVRARNLTVASSQPCRPADQPEQRRGGRAGHLPAAAGAGLALQHQGEHDARRE